MRRDQNWFVISSNVDDYLVLYVRRYINFLAEMVESDKNPISEAQIQAQKEEKKIIVHSPRGKHLHLLSS